MPTEKRIGKTLLRLVTGDIAKQGTDAVVTAAHWRLDNGAGTDGTIHTRGGPNCSYSMITVQGAVLGRRGSTDGKADQTNWPLRRCSSL